MGTGAYLQSLQHLSCMSAVHTSTFFCFSLFPSSYLSDPARSTRVKNAILLAWASLIALGVLDCERNQGRPGEEDCVFHPRLVTRWDRLDAEFLDVALVARCPAMPSIVTFTCLATFSAAGWSPMSRTAGLTSRALWERGTLFHYNDLIANSKQGKGKEATSAGRIPQSCKCKGKLQTTTEGCATQHSLHIRGLLHPSAHHSIGR